MTNIEFEVGHSLENGNDIKQKLSETINIASNWIKQIKKSKHKDALDDSILIGTVLWIIATFSVFFSVNRYFQFNNTIFLMLVCSATLLTILLSFFIYLLLRKRHVKEYEMWEERLDELYNNVVADENERREEGRYLSIIELIVDIFDENGEKWIKLLKKYAHRKAYEMAFIVVIWFIQFAICIFAFYVAHLFYTGLYGFGGIIWLVCISGLVAVYIFFSRKNIKKIESQERRLSKLLSDLKGMKENFII